MSEVYELSPMATVGPMGLPGRRSQELLWMLWATDLTIQRSSRWDEDVSLGHAGWLCCDWFSRGNGREVHTTAMEDGARGCTGGDNLFLGVASKPGVRSTYGCSVP
ncbi:hypothetical protein DPEC_G00177830 [Dallia pectoralis]|uniref:Uncharacterized protein n=1 Tax=Dallia pectoralis TaxID=75939 RepID=A0ACC2GF83_DALPE|nr:hypothetical protein DPEC_G00177830 [Dallia pectoralis]